MNEVFSKSPQVECRGSVILVNAIRSDEGRQAFEPDTPPCFRGCWWFACKEWNESNCAKEWPWLDHEWGELKVLRAQHVKFNNSDINDQNEIKAIT